ncbi:MAG: hypothetical protein AB8B64_14780 [Granulosicoccus sp.]
MGLSLRQRYRPQSPQLGSTTIEDDVYNAYDPGQLLANTSALRLTQACKALTSCLLITVASRAMAAGSRFSSKQCNAENVSRYAET